MKKLNVLILSLFCFLLASDLIAQEYKVIVNRSKNTRAVNNEGGNLKCSEFENGWWSANWKFIPVEGSTSYFHIERRNKPGQFIHVESGTPACSKLGAPGWWSAQWKLVPVSGTKYYHIVNRARGGKNYLNIEDGTLKCGALGAPGWWSAQWDLVRPESLADKPEGGVRKMQEVIDENGALIMKYQFKEAGFKYTTECSIPDWLSDPVSKEFADIFAPACHTHDYNYRAPWRIAGFNGNIGKGIADDIFYEDMLQICNNRSSNIIEEGVCKSAALTWSTTMRNHSKSSASFNSGQNQAAANCDKNSISKGGIISVYSDAGYVTEVSISYLKNDGTTMNILGQNIPSIGRASEKITALTSCEMTIPAGATGITLHVEGIACGLDFKKKFSGPVNKCYKVWGTIFDTEWKETSCN